MELRSVGVEFEAVNDDALMIEGKVNGLDWSKQLGERRRFIEKVDKGAFKRAIERSLENDKYIDLLGKFKTIFKRIFIERLLTSLFILGGNT
jgi:hypothetical protein